jgi:hypothetical protein
VPPPPHPDNVQRKKELARASEMVGAMRRDVVVLIPSYCSAAAIL